MLAIIAMAASFVLKECLPQSHSAANPPVDEQFVGLIETAIERGTVRVLGVDQGVLCLELHSTAVDAVEPCCEILVEPRVDQKAFARNLMPAFASYAKYARVVERVAIYDAAGVLLAASPGVSIGPANAQHGQWAAQPGNPPGLTSASDSTADTRDVPSALTRSAQGEPSPADPATPQTDVAHPALAQRDLSRSAR